MAIVAGVDEAGYGPLLGPLVVSATAFRVPDDAADADLWEFFRQAIVPATSRQGDKLLVGDSKVIYGSRRGLRALEENLLPFIGLLGAMPTCLRDLAERHSNARTKGLAQYPWYRDKNPSLPRESDTAVISHHVAELRRTLNDTGSAFRAARFELLHVDAFNREVAACGNKSVALARRTGNLMRHLWEEFGEEGVNLFADKQGGRKKYGAFLRSNFPPCNIRAARESAERSAYVIEHGRRRMRVSFEAKADARHLPTALASMLSKYVRELHIEVLNAYWRQRVPGLKPTAGYVVDGRRFLADIEAARRAEGIEPALLVRCR